MKKDTVNNTTAGVTINDPTSKKGIASKINIPVVATCVFVALTLAAIIIIYVKRR